MNITHSPTPWHYTVSTHNPDVWEIHAPFCESPIAEIPRWLDDHGNESREARSNVALIASAPRLYESLKLVAEMLDSFKPSFLKEIGLDATLAETLDALRSVDISEGRP